MRFMAQVMLSIDMQKARDIGVNLIIGVGYKSMTSDQLETCTQDIYTTVGNLELKKLAQWAITSALIDFYTLVTLVELVAIEPWAITRSEKEHIAKYILSQSKLCEKLDLVHDRYLKRVLEKEMEMLDHRNHKFQKMVDELRAEGYTVSKPHTT